MPAAQPAPLPPDSPLAAMQQDLQAHLALSEELLVLTREEHESLRAAGTFGSERFNQRRQDLLARLRQSAGALSQHRQFWQTLDPRQRAQNPQIHVLLRRNQEIMMKAIMFGRENEQFVLRQAVKPAGAPAAPAPAAPPNFVANLYRQHHASGR